MSETIYDFSVTNIMGLPQSLSDYKGKVVLIVNTASKCGLTPQYAGLQKLYDAYHEQGLEILGFPCNQFMQQEPGTEADIQNFCQVNYNVTFPMFSKIDVNGKNTHPLYVYLKSNAPGALGSTAIKWNFTKFLVDREGHVVQRFAPTVEPENLAPEIEALL
ncbi:MAG: glutathione peroxidase [Anaerolineae bacterium]|nr:glutathione peroxidase [Anaerolineae bacterium]